MHNTKDVRVKIMNLAWVVRTSNCRLPQILSGKFVRGNWSSTCVASRNIRVVEQCSTRLIFLFI